MLCGPCPSGLIEILTIANHAIPGCSMSTYFSDPNLVSLRRGSPRARHHQSSSWLGWTVPLEKLLRCSERSRQRAALHALAGDRHLLDDLGLTREEVLDEANRPFWE